MAPAPRSGRPLPASPIPIANPKLQKLLVALQDAKGEADAWADEVSRLQEMVLAELEADKKAIFTDTDGSTYQATRVDAEMVKTDFTALRKKLRADQWDLITDKVVNTRKLEAAITTGQINGEVVAAASHVEPRKPYVRITKKGTKQRRRK